MRLDCSDFQFIFYDNQTQQPWKPNRKCLGNLFLDIRVRIFENRLPVEVIDRSSAMDGKVESAVSRSSIECNLAED